MTRQDGRGDWQAPTFDGKGPVLVASGELLESTDPTTLDVAARVATTTREDIDDVAARSRAAFRKQPWAREPARRARVLHRYADALRGDVDRLAELLAREQGKALFEARNEVHSAADMVDYYAGLARAVYGRATVLGEDVTGVVLREPVGVVAVITPWNWPLVLLMRSLAPALAAGNTAIVKPASLTAGITVAALDLLAAEEELPADVLTCVVGSGSTIGDALVGHEAVDMIAFTGETSTGVHVMRRAAEGLRKVALELGGKSANLIFADARMDKTIEGAANAIFTTCGQICTAGSRLLVEDAVYDQVIERLGEHVAGLRVADPLAPGTNLGPLVSDAQQRAVQGYIDEGKRSGTLLVERQPDADGGHFVAPSIFGDLPPDSSLVREEIFGPVLTVQRFGSEEEALSLANDSVYGLAAGLWTTDLDRAWRVGQGLEAGTIWINTYHHFYPEAEVGGFKESGIGRQQGVEGLHEFTETKHLNFDRSPTLW